MCGGNIIHLVSLNNILKEIDEFQQNPQIQEKRCPFLQGKPVVEREIQYSHLHATINSRAQMSSDILIIAGTDSCQKLVFDEAIKQLKEAKIISDDIVILEAIQSREEYEKSARLWEMRLCCLIRCLELDHLI